MLDAAFYVLLQSFMTIMSLWDSNNGSRIVRSSFLYSSSTFSDALISAHGNFDVNICNINIKFAIYNYCKMIKWMC